MRAEVSATCPQSLQRRIAGWSARLRALGLDGLAGSLIDAVEPLGPLGAQLLWIAQPAASLFVAPDEIDGMARLLDDPAGIAWLRSELGGAASEEP